jgi:hypothetical protein
VNLLLLLTALLTSLTGMMSGDRVSVARVPAAEISAERTTAIGRTVAAEVIVAVTHRPDAALPLLRETNAPLPHALVLIPAIRLTAEKRRE